MDEHRALTLADRMSFSKETQRSLVIQTSATHLLFVREWWEEEWWRRLSRKGGVGHIGRRRREGRQALSVGQQLRIRY